MRRLHLLLGALFLSLSVCFTLSTAASRDASKAAARPARVHAIVCANWEMLLGGTVNGRWRKPADIAPFLRGGEKYQLYTLMQRLGSAVGTKPHMVNEEGYCCAQVLKLTPVPEQQEIVVGIDGTWNGLPRVPRVESNDQAVYRHAVTAFLKAKGLRVPEPHITQVLRVDLEGNGTDEVLISASASEPSEMFYSPKKGNYSVVLLRRLMKGKVSTLVLAEDYFTRNPKPNDPPLAVVFNVAAILDLTGDGRMEILVGAQVYEGESLTAYQITHGMARKLFEEGIGA